MKKALTWLREHQIEYTFHDYKAAGIDRAHLERWCRQLGWERVLNKSGTTFRKLAEAQREGLTEKRAIELMLEQPSMIKRPILEHHERLLAGFKPDEYSALFAK
jgi:Spx/MgsR family transcriptional regulator